MIGAMLKAKSKSGAEIFFDAADVKSITKVDTTSGKAVTAINLKDGTAYYLALPVARVIAEVKHILGAYPKDKDESGDRIVSFIRLSDVQNGRTFYLDVSKLRQVHAITIGQTPASDVRLNDGTRLLCREHASEVIRDWLAADPNMRVLNR
jgi:hypothetical protein